MECREMDQLVCLIDWHSWEHCPQSEKSVVATSKSDQMSLTSQKGIRKQVRREGERGLSLCHVPPLCLLQRCVVKVAV